MTAKKTIRVVTRQSQLAMWQANHVAGHLRAHPDVAGVELIPVVTKGDRILDISLQKIGGKGLFIKELEVALINEEADIAVHSMKDVPADADERFAFPALLDREIPLDVLVGATLESLAIGARVGTSSLRRQAQLLKLRPDLDIQPLRGNVDTRLKKQQAGDYDAIVLAAAGLLRLGLDTHIAERLTTAQMLPAAGQGIVGIQCRTSDESLRELLSAMDDRNSRAQLMAEREVARALQADCQSPVAAHAWHDTAQELILEALVASHDGTTIIREQVRGPVEHSVDLGQKISDALLARGAADLLREPEGESR